MEEEIELTTVLLSYFIVLGPAQGKSEVALATYKYSGMEESLKVYGETYSEPTRTIVAQSFLIGSAITNRYISYTWGF